MRLKTLIKFDKLMRKTSGKSLTRENMYDKEGKSVLPKETLKKYIRKSKYSPHQSTKEKNRRLGVNAEILF